MLNFRSIHLRLISWYSSVAILLVAVFGAYAYHSLQSRLYSEMEQTLERRAHNIAENILNKPRETIGSEIDEVYSPEENDRFIRIFSGAALIYISGQPKAKDFDVSKIPRESNPRPRRIIHLGPKKDMLLISLVANGDVIEMGALTDDIDTALRNLVVTLLIGLPIVIVLISFGGYILVRRALKPVEDIRATAEKITFGNLSNRLPVTQSGDALEHLSLTLNQMLERLETAYEQAQRFSADASHELRTPLTITRGELEALLKMNLPEEAIGGISSVLEEIERLSHITESLFAISRLDAGEAKIQSVEFDLAELVKTTTEQMQLLAVEKVISLEIITNEAVFVEGDPARLKQVVVNLLDNAIKYTAENGRVIIRVFAAGHKAVFEIIDSGIGISQEALPHIFERFYRADKVRSREIGGAGLGLSIVRSIVQAHGGHIEVESIEGKGTTCRIELPLINKGRAYS